jgi:hypothetical protein
VPAARKVIDRVIMEDIKIEYQSGASGSEFRFPDFE